MVEVGSLFGCTSRHLLKYCPQIEVLYAVDLQKPDPAQDCLAGLPRARFVQGYSHEIARRFDDASLDLVFIDADHSRESVLEDLKAWVSKVKEGGVIAGHDFGAVHHPGVKEAVKEFFRGHPHPIRLEANKVWWTVR